MSIRRTQGLLILFLATAALAGPAQRHPITHEDVWLAKRVGAPIPSPDGKQVVFSVTEPAYDEKDQVSDLWIVPSDGSAPPRRLTFTKGSESGPVWSPDSRRLAFSARREGDEVSQIYILDVAGGGEAVRATSLSTGARAPQWRPDGKALLFTSTVFPGAADDDANKKIAAERRTRKYRARVYEGFPIRNWDRWIEDTQTHLFVQSLDPALKARDLLAGTELVEEPGYAGRTGAGSDDLDAVWAPDGQSIVFVATTNRNAAAYAEPRTDLYRMPAGGGEPHRISTGKANYSRPVLSPDGKALYCLRTPDNEKIYNLDRIAVLPWPPAGEERILTAGFDRAATSFALTPDSRTVYLLSEDAGHEKLYSVPAQGGEVRLAMEMNLGAYSSLAIPGKAPGTLLFADWDSAIKPPEVVRIEPGSSRHAALSDFNGERIAAIDWQPLRHFWFTSRRGKKIHNMIALPPAFDEKKKYPLFVVIHGGPHSMWRDQFVIRWNYHLLAQPGYVVLLTNYTGSTGFGEKFAQEIQGDPLAGPGEEINEAADQAIRQFPFIDGTRQAAGGASYGGHLANWLQATTTRYRCLISHAGLVNLETQWGTSDTIYSREVTNGGPVWEQGPIWREQNPIRRAANFRTPILLSVGEQDFRVPLNNTIENWSVLQRLRIPSRLLVFPEENHWVMKGEDSRFYYQELHAWLKKYLDR
jgi:dipeptidyl aminopeptidase/acylaminoacyl peptidase